MKNNIKIISRFFIVFVLVVVCVSGSIKAQTTSVLFREAFENPGPQNIYGFDGGYAKNNNWTFEHMSSGGYDGGGAAHVRTLAGRGQYNLGWWTPNFNHTFNMGDDFYLRFRIRYDNDQRWIYTSGNENKFILIGEARDPLTGLAHVPNARMILHSHAPSDGAGCTLGMMDWSTSPATPQPWGTTGYFGLSNTSWNDPAILGWYGSLAPHVNISWDCSVPVIVTYGNNPNPPAPGPNSVPPVDGWYHVQLYVKSGYSDTAQFKVWVNNNSFTTPTSQKIGGFSEGGLSTHGWGGLVIGGYQTGIPTYDGGFRIDDVEVGLSFDPSWHPVGSEQTPPPTPKTGDLNNDNLVDIYDYNILVGNFGRTGSGIAGDIDSNGTINIFDYNLLVGNFGR